MSEQGTPTHRFTLTAAGIAACLAAIPGIITVFKGEPLAQDTWTTLKVKVDEQSKVINKIEKRMVYFQAFQEAQNSLALQQRLAELQKLYDEAVAKGVAKKPSAEECTGNQVLGDDGKCHWVKETVAVKIRKAEAVKEIFEKKLDDEKSKRIKLEQKKQIIEQLQNSQSYTKPLSPLPKNPGQ